MVEPLCQICGRWCAVWEWVTPTPYHGPHWHRGELWCYCEACGVDTFHLAVTREENRRAPVPAVPRR